jgi:hypothetical protein
LVFQEVDLPVHFDPGVVFPKVEGLIVEGLVALAVFSIVFGFPYEKFLFSEFQDCVTNNFIFIVDLPPALSVFQIHLTRVANSLLFEVIRDESCSIALVLVELILEIL